MMSSLDTRACFVASLGDLDQRKFASMRDDPISEQCTVVEARWRLDLVIVVGVTSWVAYRDDVYKDPDDPMECHSASS